MLVISTTNVTIATWTYFFGAIISTGWPALLLGIIVAAFGVTCAQLYVQAQLPVKRLMSNLRAPVLGHTGAALNGLGEWYLRNALIVIDFLLSQYQLEHMQLKKHSKKSP